MGGVTNLIDGPAWISQDWGPTSYDGEWLLPDGRHYHAGVDVAAACGLPVRASRAGTVVALGADIGYWTAGGWYADLGDAAVAIRNDADGIFLLYGHLDSNVVAKGQHVEAGDLIGHIGTKGASTGCHLHVEARTDGPNQDANTAAIVDPRPYLWRPIHLEDHMYAGPITLAPGKGVSIPGPYMGMVGTPPNNVPVNWYASACADSDDLPEGMKLEDAKPEVTVFVNGPDQPGAIFDEVRPLTLNLADAEWGLHDLKNAAGQLVCRDGAHYVIRMKNTGNVPITVHAHRDIR